MHVFFSGIGGTAIGPLALIARQAGYTVSGSDKQPSDYISYLKKQGLESISIGQSASDIAALHARQPIDWFVYSSAVAIENPKHPELEFCRQNGIKMTKRDDLLNAIITEKGLKLVAVAGTHGKTTTTAMMIWLMKQLDVPVSYSVGAKLSFGEMGQFDAKSEYFVYECDEYDRNFLAFEPYLSLITGIDWDHPDIYPTRQKYYEAFATFLQQSKHVIAHADDFERLGLVSEALSFQPSDFTLVGEVNRKNAQLVAMAASQITTAGREEIISTLNAFPGVSRRFEKLAPNLYTDYAHTPEKIRGALQMAHEVAGDKVVVVYEGLHNTRQHFIKDDLKHLFDDVQKLIVVPSYLAREDESLDLLSPQDIIDLTDKPEVAEPHELDDSLKKAIQSALDEGSLVLCLTAGGGGSLDEWLRREFTP
jgi:UDP-N-acetylmuramate--alanine ligase